MLTLTQTTHANIQATSSEWIETKSTVPFDANDKVVVVTGLAPASEYEVVIEARYNYVGANIDDSNEKRVTARSAVSVFRTASNDTVWINPHRVTENDLTTLDFLSNHNSGTLDADVGFITMGGNSSHFFKLYVTAPSLPFPSLPTSLPLPFPFLPFPHHCPFPSLSFPSHITAPSLSFPSHITVPSLPFPSHITVPSLPFPSHITAPSFPFPRHCPFSFLPTSLPLPLSSPKLHLLLLLNVQSPRRRTHCQVLSLPGCCVRACSFVPTDIRGCNLITPFYSTPIFC
jgi:hypothetical protein